MAAGSLDNVTSGKVQSVTFNRRLAAGWRRPETFLLRAIHVSGSRIYGDGFQERTQSLAKRPGEEAKSKQASGTVRRVEQHRCTGGPI